MMKRSTVPHSGLSRDEAQALGGLVALFVITAAWWALALWPVESGPAWLARTRYVCFGVAESGLPDTAGWIGLVGGPAGMLAVLIVGWQEGLRGLLRRAPASRGTAATLAALALGCLVLVTGAAVRVQQGRVPDVAAEAPAPLPESYPRLDRPAPALALTAQNGEILDLSELRGRPVLVTFAFAHCQTICPIVVKDALAAQSALREDGLEPAVLIVTLDPWRDTPSRLPAMAADWRLPDRNAWVLSGEVAEVEAVLDRWNVPRGRSETTGDVTHPSLVYILDAEGTMAYALTGGAAAIESLVRRL